MNILGITSSFALGSEENIMIGDDFGLGHDSSASLVSGGNVLAAMEEERKNRIKHTNKAPVHAIRDCLKNADLDLNEIDFVALNFKKDTIKLNIKKSELAFGKKMLSVEEYINRIFIKAVGQEIDINKIIYVPHHEAHAESSYYLSGFDEAIVIIVDGVGDNSAGMVQYRRGNTVKILDTISIDNSLGLFYLDLISFLGYHVHDEYKVMGLAPYGDYRKYEKIFKKFYRLLPEGKFSINRTAYNLLFDIGLPRFEHEKFSQMHMDIAASIQYSLESIILHIVKYYADTLKVRNLCMAGGVVHNCSVAGKILESGLFDDIFIQPAAGDAGTSLGAALFVAREKNEFVRKTKIREVFWGENIGDDDEIRDILEKWKPYIDFYYSKQIEVEAAELIADGNIVGWVQGKTEYGPRALGHRSILADPRKATNKSIINSMVKKRESYRPFAPSVLKEYADEYFEISNSNIGYEFMNFIVHIKEEKRNQLQAVTHIDGTGRVQIVSKDIDVKYWSTIEAFRKITGIPVLLNTSFNNFAEPIVDTVEDAIISFLTTQLDNMIVGNYVINRKEYSLSAFLNLYILLVESTQLLCKSVIEKKRLRTQYFVSSNYGKRKIEVTEKLYHKLMCVNDKQRLSQLFSIDELENGYIQKELYELWEARLINLIASNESL